VIIFLFLKGAGENSFSIPVYYTEGIPDEQQFNCDFPNGAYQISWPDSLAIDSPVLLFYSQDKSLSDQTNKRNIFRRIVGNSKTEVELIVFNSGKPMDIPAVTGINISEEELRTSMHCLVASDTLNQFILVDSKGQIRGYYHTSLKEQDRLLVELEILGIENE
jgi:hypothetical protein